MTVPTTIRAHTDATVALYGRIGESYQRWWAPVIEPAAIGSLERIEPTVVERPGALILDLGAGTGTLAREAVRRWPAVRTIALDASAAMLDLGRAEASRTLDPPSRRRIAWVTGVAEQLPFEDGSIDVVVSSFAIQYFPSRALALREARRVLRSDGVISVVGWLANDRPFRPWQVLAELMTDLGIESPPSLEPGVFRSLRAAAALFRRAGFREVRTEPGTVEHDWAIEPLVRCSLDVSGSVDADASTWDELERRWTARLAELPATELHLVDPVAYVKGAAG